MADALFIATDNRNKEIVTDAFNNVDKEALQTIFKGLNDYANKINFEKLIILLEKKLRETI